MPWGWVKHGLIFIFGWTKPLRLCRVFAEKKKFSGGIYMMPFLTKKKTFCILEVHLHNNTFWEPENANFGKQVSEYTFLKTIPLLSLCKPQKCEFVKTVTSCAHVTSSVYKYVCRHVVFLYKVTANYWPGMDNTAFFVVFVAVWMGSFCCRVVCMWNLSKIDFSNVSIFSTVIVV